MYIVSWLGLLFLSLILLFEIVILFNTKTGVKAQRILPEKFSNGDNNPVPVRVINTYAFKVFLQIIDELPVQFQKRDFLKSATIEQGQHFDFEYALRPVTRGPYFFGHLHVFVSSKLKLAKRRFSFDKAAEVKVYPSFIQMKKYDFLAIDQRLSRVGLKQIRRIGHTMEFEQIKEYIKGDDIRTVNWKATAKHGSLMVNQYQDEKSQPIYSLIDVSRVMKMPFEGLSLLDYAINSTLAFSNIAVKKQDKVGMLTFSKTVHDFLPANGKKTYVHAISEALYGIKTGFLDADFSTLYAHVKRKITQRSLLLLYTNFEHISALKRQLPYLKALAKKHLLVVIFFENTELDTLISLKKPLTYKTFMIKQLHNNLHITKRL